MVPARISHHARPRVGHPDSPAQVGCRGHLGEGSSLISASSVSRSRPRWRPAPRPSLVRLHRRGGGVDGGRHARPHRTTASPSTGSPDWSHVTLIAVAANRRAMASPIAAVSPVTSTELSHASYFCSVVPSPWRVPHAARRRWDRLTPLNDRPSRMETDSPPCPAGPGGRGAGRRGREPAHTAFRLPLRTPQGSQIALSDGIPHTLFELG